MRKILLLISVIFWLWACEEEPDCNLEQGHKSIGVKFYNSEDSTDLFLKFVAISARGTDSIVYNSDDSLSLYSLNLNPTSDRVTYVFLGGTNEDTLTLGYTKQLNWLSETCGPSFFYENLEVISSSFDNELSSPIIDIAIDENIKIYY